MCNKQATWDKFDKVLQALVMRYQQVFAVILQAENLHSIRSMLSNVYHSIIIIPSSWILSLSLCYILESLCQSLCLSLSHTVSLHFVQVLSLSLLHTPKQIFSLSLADTNMTLERSFWSVCLKRKQQWGPQPKG